MAILRDSQDSSDVLDLRAMAVTVQSRIGFPWQGEAEKRYQ